MSWSPSMAMPTESAERPAPRRAASRAASTGVPTSPGYGANAAFSSSQPFVAPQAPSCLTPSSVALSVTHTASTLPPDSRPASPSTSAITFFGAPFRSSSTMHQNAFAISDRLRFLAQRADQLLHGVLHLTGDHASRRPRRQRLQS